MNVEVFCFDAVAPVRERGLKFTGEEEEKKYGVAAGRERGLKLEPKEIKTVPSMADIAKDIYIDRGYKELIEFQGIDIYIPASIGGEGNA